MRVAWPDSRKNSSSTNKEASSCPGLLVLLPGPAIWGHQGKGGEQSFTKREPYSPPPDSGLRMRKEWTPWMAKGGPPCPLALADFLLLFLPFTELS